MRKFTKALIVATLTMSVLCGCTSKTETTEVKSIEAESTKAVKTEATKEVKTTEETEVETTEVETTEAIEVEVETEVKKEITSVGTPAEVKAFLLENNKQYVESGKNIGDISAEKRQDTTDNGQHPYATVITCSDSRVPAEHVFNAGIGELFVIRTAGNVIGDYELGSVEYGAEHLGTPLVVVMGHTNCGAVAATLEGGAHGNIAHITDEIASSLTDEVDATEAEILNVKNSIERIKASEEMTHLIEEGKVEVVGAIYDIATGSVTFLED